MREPVFFISYRRADAEGHAGRLWDRLRLWFDAEALFYDQGRIDSGDVFPERIEQALNAAKVVLVLIAPSWQRILAERAAKPELDWVRREVEIALERSHKPGGSLVIPVLLGGAEPPSAEALPESLRPLCQLEVHRFIGKDADWSSQFERLRDQLAEIASIPARFRLPSGQSQPFRVIEHLLSPHFQDPEDRLGDLRAALKSAGTAAVVARAALYGMGGVGKTQLTLKYSHAFRHAYAGVWWFRAENPESVELDALACCTECGVPVPEGSPPSAALKRWLVGQPTWLLVYDNAEDVESLRRFLPDGGGHHVIITSRNPAWGGIAQPVSLETWTPEQGANFLATRLPGADRRELLKLADTRGGLPLALEQAAGFLEETGMAVDDYRAEAERFESAPLVLDEGRAATGYERSVLATLSIAFGRLSPGAAQLLRLCAFFAAEPIPERFFREKPDALPDSLAAAVRNALVWGKTVGQLRRFGLADRVAIPALDREPGSTDARTEQALILHRLTQEVTRHKLCVVPDDCLTAQSMLRLACPVETNLPALWPRLASLLLHVRHLERFCSAGWIDNRRHSWLLHVLGSYLRSGPALYAESRRLLEHAVELDRDELGEEHPVTLLSMDNLALTFQVQGDLAGARQLQERVLDLQRRVLGEEHPDIHISMHNLAATLRAQGDLAGARQLQERVLDLQRRVLGEKHPYTLLSMNNLADTLQAQGDLAGARRLQERVLDLQRRVLGEEHPDTFTSMHNLAATLQAQGDLAGARRLQERVLDLQRRVLGEKHPETSISAWTLFVSLDALGDVAAARRVQEEHLLWLLDRDLATLGAYQRQIREKLVAFLGHDPPESDTE